MAQKINLKKGNLSKPGYLGFSWTVFFFGFLVPFIRGDIKWGLIMFFIPFSNVVLAFIYNKIYTRNLLEEEWVPADGFSKELLLIKEMINPDDEKEYITQKNDNDAIN